jgi:hypothetical protein
MKCRKAPGGSGIRVEHLIHWMGDAKEKIDPEKRLLEKSGTASTNGACGLFQRCVGKNTNNMQYTKEQWTTIRE